MQIDTLNAAFRNFTEASKSLETWYGELSERIAYLTNELEAKNRRLNDALADAERNKEHLRAVLYNLEEAIVAVDDRGVITTMNRSAETLLETPAAEALGRPFSSLTFALNAGEAGMTLDVRGRRYDVIVSHSDALDAEGRLLGRVILIKDVTRLRELEQLHERNQRLIAMGEMAAKLVHEIRNPLCSVELYAGMLERELTDPARKDLARGVTEGIGSLNTIVTNMLLFARPAKPSAATMRLDRALGEALRMLLPMTEARGIAVETTVAACEVRGDAELAKQALLNVLINAVQAMPDGGKLDVTMEGRDGAAAVHVKDTGTGIARENLERIFDPFFTTKETGTGLGLVIAANIMRANGGYIKAASEPGKGSVFSLHFPALAVAVNRVDAAEAAGVRS